MPVSARTVSISQIKEKVGEILESKRNPLFSLIQGVEACDDKLLIPVSGVSAQNQDMAGEKLAKAMADELTRSSLGVGSCVASFDIYSDGTASADFSSGRSDVDVDALADFLRENLRECRLKPHTVNLVTVTFGKKWSYLTIVCSKESLRGRSQSELEASFRSLRKEFQEKFDIRLRLVLQPPPSTHVAERFDTLRADEERLAEERPSLQGALATLVDNSTDSRRVVGRPGRLADWSGLYLCSVDSAGVRQIEDVFGEGPESDPTSGAFDLRVCHPLAIKDLNSLEPTRDLQPALGIKALVGSSGELLRSEVDLVIARNSRALDAGLATRMIDAESRLPEEQSVDWSRAVDDPRLIYLLSRLKGLAGKVAENERLRGDVGVLDLTTPADEIGHSRVMRRAEVLVASIMRFTQRCIMRWRDNLDNRPSIIVSRPALKSDRALEKILAVLECDESQILDPGKNREQADCLRRLGRPELVKTLADVVSAAYNSRRTVVVGPEDFCRSGDVLPIKRRGYGFINNLQVASAVLGFDSLAFDKVSVVTNPARAKQAFFSKGSADLDREVRGRKARLLELLYDRRSTI
jgi:hypothetical protein